MFKKALVIISAVAMLLCAVCVFTVASVSAEDTALQAAVKAAIAKEMKFNTPVASDFLTNDGGWHQDGEAGTGNGHWATDVEGAVHIYNKGHSTACLGFDWKGEEVNFDGFHMVIGPVTWIEDNQRFFGMNIGAALSRTGGQSWGDQNMMFRINTKTGDFAVYANDGWAGAPFEAAQIVMDMEKYTTMFEFDINDAGDMIVTLSNSNGDYAVGTALPADKFPSKWTDHTKAHIALTGSNTSEAFKFDIYAMHDGDTACGQKKVDFSAVKAAYGVSAADFSDNNSYWAGLWGPYGIKINTIEGGVQADILAASTASLGVKYNKEITKLDGALLVVANVSDCLTIGIGAAHDEGPHFGNGANILRIETTNGNIISYPGGGGDKIFENSDVVKAMANGETGIYFNVDESGNVSLILQNDAGVQKGTLVSYGSNWTDHTKANILFTTHNINEVEAKIDILAVRNGDVDGAAEEAEEILKAANLAKSIADFIAGAKDDADIFGDVKWTSNQGAGDDTGNTHWGPGGAGGYVGGSYTGSGCETSVNADGSKHVYVGDAGLARFITKTMSTYAPDGLTMIVKNLKLEGATDVTLNVTGVGETWVILKNDGTAAQMYDGWGAPGDLTVTGDGNAIKGLFEGKMTKFVIGKSDSAMIITVSNESGDVDVVNVSYGFSDQVAGAKDAAECTIGLGRWNWACTYALQYDSVAVYSGKNGTTVKAEEAAAAKDLVSRINAIGQVTADSKDTIEGIEADYAAANDRVKAQVSNYATLTGARAILDEIIGGGAAAQAAAAVEALINAIGEVTTESGDAIKAAEEAYAALDDMGKSIVTNYATLTAARAKFNTLSDAAKYDGLKKTYDFAVKVDELTVWYGGWEVDDDELNSEETGIAISDWSAGIGSWGTRVTYNEEVALAGLQVTLKNLDHLKTNCTVAVMDSAGSWVDLKGSMIRFTIFAPSEAHPNGYLMFGRHNGSLSVESMLETEFEVSPFTDGVLTLEFEVADEENVAVFANGQFMGVATREWLGLGAQDGESPLKALNEATGFVTFNFYEEAEGQYFSVYSVTSGADIAAVKAVEEAVAAIGAIEGTPTEEQIAAIDAAEKAYKGISKVLRKYVANYNDLKAAMDARDEVIGTEEPTEEPTETDSPKTGEATALLPIAMLIVAAGALVISRKRK